MTFYWHIIRLDNTIRNIGVAGINSSAFKLKKWIGNSNTESFLIANISPTNNEVHI